MQFLVIVVVIVIVIVIANHGVQVHQALQHNRLWTWPAFTSTSTEPRQAHHFGAYTFEIHSVYGRDISEFSGFANEKEVLFVPGTCVRVMEVRDDCCVLHEGMIV